ncbi:hypothetical protein DT075_16815 [Bacillus licheniformis]|nr:hypothetical protein DT075_16815 [Bacillus licheniformis]
MTINRLMLLLLCIIILVAMIGFSLKNDRNATWPEKFIGDTTGVFQTIFHTPAQFFAGFFENIEDLKNTYSGALLRHLDKVISEETKMPVLIAEDPLDCVAIGTGKALEQIHLFKGKN